jgi:hypothetical protein
LHGGSIYYLTAVADFIQVKVAKGESRRLLQQVGRLFRGQGGTGTGLKLLARKRHNSIEAKRFDRRPRGVASLWARIVWPEFRAKFAPPGSARMMFCT